MRRKGFTWLELVIVVGIIGIFMAVIIPSLSVLIKRIREERSLINFRTDVSVTFRIANPRIELLSILSYEVPDRWGYDSVRFISGLDGDLRKGYCFSKGKGSLMFSPDSKIHSEPESWDIWCQRFEEIRKEVVTGFKPGAKEFFQKQKEN